MLGWNSTQRWGRRLVTFLLVAAMTVPPGMPVVAQDFVPAETAEDLPYTEDYSGALLLNSYGTQLRVGHSEGPAVGRYDSITSFELFHSNPVGDDSTLFYDFRFLMDNDAHFGGNVGAGYRKYLPEWSRLVGASLWYDGDAFNEKDFHQFGLSLETLGDHCDARLNAYFPFGDDEQTYARSTPTTRFRANQLVFDQIRFDEEALTGFDAEVGAPLPCELGFRYNVRGYAGLYHFSGGTVDDILGVSGRLEARVRPDLNLEVAITNDDQFNTHVVFGVIWYMPSGRSISCIAPTMSARDRLEDRVRRNLNVVIARTTNPEVYVATDPRTGQPLHIVHANSEAAAGGDGTVERPFQMLAEAEAASGTRSIIFAHADSIFDNDQIALQDRQRLLGEGDNMVHFVETAEFGTALLPRATSGSTLPEITGAPGFAVALADDVRVAGFTISDSAGPGIFADGVSGNVEVDTVLVESSAGIGVNLVNSSANFDFRDTFVDSDGTGDAVAIAAGAPTVNFDGEINNLNGGRAVSVTNTTGGAVNITGAVNDDSGLGVLVDGADGDVSIANLEVNAGNSTGIDVRNSSGSILFNGVTINDTVGNGVNLTNNTGPIELVDLSLSNDGSRGIFAQNNDMLIFSGTNVVDVANAGGIDISNSTVDGAFESIVVAGGAGNGVSLNDVDGSLAVTDEITIDTITGTGVSIQNSSLDFSVASLVVDGAADGIFLNNNTGGFALGDALADTGGGSIENVSGFGVRIANSAEVALHSLSIDSSGANDGLQAVNSGSADSRISLTELEIAGAGNEGLDLRSTGTGTLFVNVDDARVTSTNNALNAETTAAGAGLELALNDVRLNSADRAGAEIDGSAGGTLTVTDFRDVFVNNGDDGVIVRNAVFDADTSMAGIQTVSGGTSRIGTIGNRIMGDGYLLDQVSGHLAYDELNVFSAGGFGVSVNGSGVNPFTFETGAGTVNARDGESAVSIQNTALAATFTNITSTNSNSTGITLDSVTGSFAVTGTTTINEATQEGIKLANITDPAATFTFGTVDIDDGEDYGIALHNFAGSATFGETTIGAPAVGPNSGIHMLNSSGSVEIADLSLMGGGIDVHNTTGSFTVNGGTIINSNGMAVDILLGSPTVTLTDTIVSVSSGGPAVNVNMVSGGSLTGDGFTIFNVSNLLPGMSAVRVNANNSSFDLNLGSVVVNDDGDGKGVSITNLGTGGSANIDSVLANGVETGIELSNSAGTFTFDSLSVDGATDGLKAENLTGSLTVGSGSMAGDGGTIQNVTGTGISLLNVAGGTFQFLSIDASGGDNAFAAMSDNANDMTLLFDTNSVLGADMEGIDLNNAGTGTFSATLLGNSIVSTGDSFNAALTNPAGSMGLNLSNNAANGAYTLDSGASTIDLGGPAGTQGMTFINSDGDALKDTGNTTGGADPTVNATGTFDIVDPATIPTP